MSNTNATKTTGAGKYRVMQFGPLGPRTIGFYRTKKDAEYARRIAGDAVIVAESKS